MLDIMRRHKRALKPILTITVIGVAGSFGVALYGVWGGGLSGTAQGATNWILVVNGERVPAKPFQQRRNILLQDYRNQFGGQGIDDEQLVPLAERQAMQELLGLELARSQARDSDLVVTDMEVRESILTHPSFQRGGRFVGLERYRDLLRAQGREPAEYESEVSQILAAEKVRLAVSGLAHVGEEELERRFREEVERVDVDYILLADSEYAEKGSPSASALQQFFNEHSGDYMSAEARQVSIVVFDREARAETVQVPEDEVRQDYERNRESLYSHGEQRRASHILFRVETDATPEDEGVARQRAEEVLAQARSGADFAELARQHSDDATSAPGGGDLGYFEQGRMVREFEEAAFSVPAGQISDPVKTAFGYHIIKVTEERAAGTQPLEEVREEIRRGLAVQGAQQVIREDADAFTTRIATAEGVPFEQIAAELGLQIRESAFFSRGEPIEGLGRLPQVDDAVFTLEQVGDSTPAVAVSQGLAVFNLRQVRPSAPAPYEEVQTEVEEDYRTAKARERARTTADRVLSADGTLRDRAGRRSIEVKNFPAVNRVQPLPPLTAAAKEAAFAAPLGAVLGPYEADDGLLILEVKGRSPSTPDQIALERETLRDRLLMEERTDLYRTLLIHLQNSATIDINEGLLRSSQQSG